MPPTITGVKRMRVNNEPVFVHEDGKIEEYIPQKLETARDAYSVSLHMLFKHIADFHMCTIEIIAEKTGMKEEDILNTILEDPRYKDMFVHPVLNSFGYVHKKDVAKVVPEVSDVKADAEPPTEDKIVEATEVAAPKKTTKKVVVKKLEAVKAEQEKKIAEAVKLAEATAAMATTTLEEAPKKKKTLVRPKAKTTA
jgi:hypothetical protein